MGTRADFYVGRGPGAEWIGSIAWDGYPEGIDDAVLRAKAEDTFRSAVAGHLDGREDATRVADGWPWPWDDSRTTDYAYAFDCGRVWASCFGGEWFVATEECPDDAPQTAVFPDMSGRRQTTFGPRSGLLVVQSVRR